MKKLCVTVAASLALVCGSAVQANAAATTVESQQSIGGETVEAPSPQEADIAIDGVSSGVAPTAADAAAAGVTVTSDPAEFVNVGGGSSVGIGVPAAATSSEGVERQGRMHFANENGSTTVVNPAADGAVQLLVAIAGPAAPTRYDFPVQVPVDGSLILTDDGGVQILEGSGSPVGSISAPWAEDAAGREVPTRYEIAGTKLVQIVEHSDANTYPVVADPKLFSCDLGTHLCVKFTKAQTKKIAGHTGAAGGLTSGGAAILCGYISGGLAAGICATIVGTVAGALGDSFTKAAAKGKCIELHFLKPFFTLTRWKTESC